MDRRSGRKKNIMNEKHLAKLGVPAGEPTRAALQFISQFAKIINFAIKDNGETTACESHRLIGT